MKLAFALLALVTAAAFTAPAQAQGQNGLWCAEYGNGHGGKNCGFSTYQQCRAAISGFNTGTCTPNPSRAYWIYR